MPSSTISVSTFLGSRWRLSISLRLKVLMTSVRQSRPLWDSFHLNDLITSRTELNLLRSTSPPALIKASLVSSVARNRLHKKDDGVFGNSIFGGITIFLS